MTDATVKQRRAAAAVDWDALIHDDVDRLSAVEQLLYREARLCDEHRFEVLAAFLI